ncbi:MAG: hypothetical protein U5K84_09345 [Alkalibacterium sp.]|nr:hypothetical protein [Alkalibacterium sp.]
MTEKHGKFFIYNGHPYFPALLFVVTRDPIIGGIGLIVGLWNIFMGYLTSKGKSLFKSKDD